MNHERLWTLGNKLRASEGRGVGDWDRPVIGIKEDTYCMVHWVLCANNESWNIESKTGDVGPLGGTAVKRLPSAQGMIPALWDRAPHQAPPL